MLAGLAVAVLRYEPWVHTTIVGSDGSLDGWSLPWLGPLSLIATGLVAVGVVVTFVHRGPAGPLLAALAGWLVTVCAAIVLIAASAVGRSGAAHLDVSAVTGVPLDDVEAGFSVGSAVGGTFAAGLAVATAAALVLWSRIPARGSSW